ncbi:DNA primase family protein [Rummeliibacillus stabekisii]|uniref:SF3 helicase domain-containing protein n=1 Tax=Rummeliibacillus stabekisii TaxID=241244 RepID=A0A143HGI7_9BACL|nr:phage/plasmid primase, P4 family [Rummeliibacillus stabekisii]AMX00372.1 hypothetical protein ATY39_13690 [Rummeliibacillus stabekisii]
MTILKLSNDNVKEYVDAFIEANRKKQTNTVMIDEDILEDDEITVLEEERREREAEKDKQLKTAVDNSIAANEVKGSKDNVIQIKNVNWYRYNKDGEITRFMPGRLVDTITSNVKSVVVNNDFFIYSDGYYKKVRDEYIEGLIQDNIDSSIRTYGQICDVFNQWKTNRKVFKEDKQINTKPFLMNLKNGIFDIKNNTFQEGHETEVIMTRRVDANYNPSLLEDRNNGKAFHEFLDFVQPDPTVQAVIQEIMGYCLSDLVEAQKFFVFDGVSRSGKSTIISLIERMIAPENISHVALQDLYGFNLYSLYNKSLNTMADLPATAIPAESMLKCLSGEDPIHADRKHKEAISFMSTAKLLFSTNGMPKNHGDKGDAFFQRLIIVPFKIQVPENKRDRMLKYKLNQEIDYIFNFALQGLIRLVKSNFEFTKSEIIQKKNELYKQESNSLLQFINDCCEIDKYGYANTKLFMEFYKEYCKTELEIEPQKKKTVLKYLVDNYGVEYGENIRVPGAKERALKGIKLKKERDKFF